MYQTLSVKFHNYTSVVDAYNAAFPFLNDLQFREKMHVYDYGTTTGSDIGAERSYLMGEGDLPDSLNYSFTRPMEPFTPQEIRYVRERFSWEARLNAVDASNGATFSDPATTIWPRISDPDLKELVRFIGDHDFFGPEQQQVARDFSAADSRCGLS